MKGRAAVLWVLLQCKLASHAYRNLQNPCTFVLTFECQASSCQLRTSTQKRRKLETLARPSFKVKQKLRPLALQILTAPSTYFLYSIFFPVTCTVSKIGDSCWKLWTCVKDANFCRLIEHLASSKLSQQDPGETSRCIKVRRLKNRWKRAWPGLTLNLSEQGKH